jgi:pyruvate formate lyase activating enzyme
MGTCSACGKQERRIAAHIGLCGECVVETAKRDPDLPYRVHAAVREEFGLPTSRSGDGALCSRCVNRCRIPEGEAGLCGVRRSEGGRIVGVGKRAGVQWYYDPLPTNCVGMPFCAGSGGVGYPEYSVSEGEEWGCQNLAVFYQACGFDCLFCQNWHFRDGLTRPTLRTAEQLAAAVDRRTTCICYFGGDPTPQIEHALAAARLARDRAGGRILRICWETNGSMNLGRAREAMRLSLESGGCVKFDLKALTPELHQVLCGTSNEWTLRNFRALAEMAQARPAPPGLIASTLLVPGYVTPDEVARIAAFIATCGPDIPYALLGFYPQFYMNDLPTTSRREAEACLDAAQNAGLTRVRLGNEHLLI